MVGVTGFVLGGGSSITNSITGYGSDQIISARLVTAKAELLDVTEDKQPDLLWALRGAGHFFGVITQLIIKAYPLSLLGTKDGTLWAGSFVFPLERAREVGEIMGPLMDDSRYATSGLIMTMAPPPHRKPSLIISARFTGDPSEAEDAYRPLYDLKPFVASGSQVPIQNISDGREAIGAKGDFKRFGIIGLRRFELDSFLKTINIWRELISECPDAINTAFNFQWDSRSVRVPPFDSAMCLHDTRFWQYVSHSGLKTLLWMTRLISRNNLIWHTDVSNRQKVDEYNARCLSIMRGSNPSEWADYQNRTRDGPIELRFRGKERLARLKTLKKQWDPTGLFTSQLLV